MVKLSVAVAVCARYAFESRIFIRNMGGTAELFVPAIEILQGFSFALIKNISEEENGE